MLAAFFRLPRLSKGSKGKRPQATLNLRWDESKHPRGQADNAGQFSSAPGASGSQATATAQAGDPRFTQATGAAAKLGQKRTLARVNTRLKFGVEDIVFTEQEKAQSPYTWRVKHVAAACNLFEPMAMWVLDDAMVAALRRECVANDDQVGLMLVDLHRDRRAAFTARQREEARGVVFAMLKQAARAAGNGHNGSNGSNGNGLTKAVTLEELFMPPAARRRRGLFVVVGGWLRKAAGQLALFDEGLHPRHPAGSERGGQFREKRSAAQAGGQARKPAAPSVPNAFLAPDGTLLPLGRSENHKMWLSAHRQILKRYLPDPEQALRAESEGTYSFGRLLAHGFARKSSPAGAKVLGYSISALAPDPDAVVGMVAADVDAEVDAHLSRGADIDEVAVQVEVWGEGSSPSMVEFPLGEVASGKSEVLKRLRRGIAQVAPTPEEEAPQEQVRQVGGSYQDRVALTMEHLDTRLDEWAAVPVKGMVDAVGEDDKPVKAPEFDFPTGYEVAKSPFASAGFGDTSCELCGHPIKRVYWIQHDGKKLVMAVGSECVTLFEGKSGSALAKEAEHQQRVDLLLEGREASRRMYEEFNEGGTLKRTHGKPYELWQRLRHLTDPSWGGRNVPVVDEEDLARLPERERRMRDDKPATKAQVTRFVNAHEEELRALLAAADELSAGGDPELPRNPSYDPDREAYRQARRLLDKLESGEWEAGGGILGQRRVAELTYMLRLKDGSLPADTDDLSDEQVELWRAGRSSQVGKHARKLMEKLLSAAGQEESALQKAIGPRRVLVAFRLRKSQLNLFDETAHPRHSKGPRGGQFAPKEKKQVASASSGVQANLFTGKPDRTALGEEVKRRLKRVSGLIREKKPDRRAIGEAVDAAVEAVTAWHPDLERSHHDPQYPPGLGPDERAEYRSLLRRAWKRHSKREGSAPLWKQVEAAVKELGFPSLDVARLAARWGAMPVDRARGALRAVKHGPDDFRRAEGVTEADVKLVGEAAKKLEKTDLTGSAFEALAGLDDYMLEELAGEFIKPESVIGGYRARAERRAAVAEGTAEDARKVAQRVAAQWKADLPEGDRPLLLGNELADRAGAFGLETPEELAEVKRAVATRFGNYLAMHDAGYYPAPADRGRAQAIAGLAWAYRRPYDTDVWPVEQALEQAEAAGLRVTPKLREKIMRGPYLHEDQRADWEERLRDHEEKKNAPVRKSVVVFRHHKEVAA